LKAIAQGWIKSVDEIVDPADSNKIVQAMAASGTGAPKKKEETASGIVTAIHYVIRGGVRPRDERTASKRFIEQQEDEEARRRSLAPAAPAAAAAASSAAGTSAAAMEE
jgi:hypothetical protein